MSYNCCKHIDDNVEYIYCDDCSKKFCNKCGSFDYYLCSDCNNENDFIKECLENRYFINKCLKKQYFIEYAFSHKRVKEDYQSSH